jgi:hypothetical protein
MQQKVAYYLVDSGRIKRCQVSKGDYISQLLMTNEFDISHLFMYNGVRQALFLDSTSRNIRNSFYMLYR